MKNFVKINTLTEFKLYHSLNSWILLKKMSINLYFSY